MTDTQLHTRSRSAFLSSEDWWAVWLGLFIFALGAGRIWDADLLGWAAKFGVWMDPAKAAAANSPAFAWLGGAGAVVVTYLFVLILTTIGAWFMGGPDQTVHSRFLRSLLAYRCSQYTRQLCLSGSDAG